MDGTEKYVIKKDILIQNYKSFLLEFYGLIEVDFNEEAEMTLDEIPIVHDFDEFIQTFSYDKRGYYVPFIYGTPYAFFVIGCTCNLYWLFYRGSYKAILEEYTSLLHFEKVLARAMSNPLSNAVKFGIFG